MPIVNLLQRVDPGDIVPSGQCPYCDGLCYLQASVQDFDFVEAEDQQPSDPKRSCVIGFDGCDVSKDLKVCYLCEREVCEACSRLVRYFEKNSYIRACMLCIDNDKTAFGLHAHANVEALFAILPREGRHNLAWEFGFGNNTRLMTPTSAQQSTSATPTASAMHQPVVVPSTAGFAPSKTTGFAGE
jgi:hypothetical protein